MLFIKHLCLTVWNISCHLHSALQTNTPIINLWHFGTPCLLFIFLCPDPTSTKSVILPGTGAVPLNWDYALTDT